MRCGQSAPSITTGWSHSLRGAGFFIFRAKKRKLILSDVILHWYIFLWYRDLIKLEHSSYIILPLEMYQSTPMIHRMKSKFFSRHSGICSSLKPVLLQHCTPTHRNSFHWPATPRHAGLCSCCSSLQSVLAVLFTWCSLIHLSTSPSPVSCTKACLLSKQCHLPFSASPLPGVSVSASDL